MKRMKWLSILISLFVTLFLVACTPEGEIDFDVLFTAAQAEIDLAGNVTEDVTLPTSIDVDGITVNVSWASSAPTVISTTGDVTRPPFETGNVSVILTATFTYLEETHTHDFTVIVQALPVETFQVTYYSKGAVYQTVTTDKNAKLTAPTAPTPAAYEVFGGWYKEETFVNPWSFTEDTVTAEVSLYAKWNAVPQYTVSFNAGNGSDITTQQIHQGDKIPTVAAPVKTGYTFVSWVLEDETVWNFEVDVVTAPITLYATYTLNTYTITYILPDGATIVDPGQSTYNFETPINDLTTVTKEYADFVGWFDSLAGGNQVTGHPAGTITGNITLYARFTDHVPFNVTFDDPKGVDVVQTRYEGQYAEAIADPVHPGYTFIGWFKNVSDVEPYSFMEQVLADVTLTAKYALIEYAITYQADGGTHSNATVYNVETPTITLEAAIKANYVFTGWFDAEVGGNQVTSIPLGSTGHKTLYARYSATSYTITYELDGGTLLESNPATYTVLTPTFTLNAPSKDGYQFIGWFDAEVGGNKVTSIVLGSFGNITLFARFSELIDISYYAFVDVEIETIKASSDWPQTFIALSRDNNLYTNGDGTYGLLGNGSFEDSEMWINITPRFNLALGEVIVSYDLTQRQALVLTSFGRVFVWGFLSDDGIEIYLNEPMDISEYSVHAEDEILNIFPVNNFFLFETAEGLFLFNNALVTDITPNLAMGETIEWAPLFGFGESPSPLAFTTASSIYLFDPYNALAFVNITTELNLGEEEIIAVLSQDTAIHVITETTYRFAQFTGSIEMPLVVIDIPVTITMEANEIAQQTFGGGALFTSANRILIPYYIYGESDEMPEEVIYVDITPELGLLEGETIVALHDPFFIETSTGRILIVIMENNENVDPENIPLPDVMDIEIDQYLLPGEVFEGFEFNQYEIYLRTNQRYALVEFGQNGLLLDNLSFQTIGLVYQGQVALYDIENNLFTPETPLYQAFAGWYLDDKYTVPFEANLAVDGMNLYARFVNTHYFISFELYGEGNIPMMAVEIDEIPVAPEPPLREHYEFVEWYYFDDFGYHIYDFSYALNQNVVLYASYQSVQYDVTFVFDGFDPIVTQVSALTLFGDLNISAPEGYEVIAVYMDADMLIPMDPENQLVGDQTFYVAIDPVTVQVTYYNDLEDINFVALYPSSSQAYGMTADGRIFGWGSNYLGALGVGYESIPDFPMPYDMTALFGFGVGETISIFSTNYNAKTVLSSENRVFIWGYYRNDGMIQSVVNEITNEINLQPGQTVVHLHTDNNGTYLFLNDGTILYYSFANESVKTMNTGLVFGKIIFVQQLFYGSNELFIVANDGIYDLRYDMETNDLIVTNLSVNLEGDEVFYTKLNYQTYGEIDLYTKEGRIYRVNYETHVFELVVDFVLNPGEELENAFIIQWDTMAFWTNQDRLLAYNTSLTVFDTSVLNPGEDLLTFEYGSQFFTSDGRTVYRDMGSASLFSPLDQFVLNGNTVIRYVTLNWILYAEYDDHTFWQTGGTEFVETIGIHPTVEFYQYGDEFSMIEPTPKPGYMFHGWVDIQGNLYSETPTSDMLLYPYWTLSE